MAFLYDDAEFAPAASPAAPRRHSPRRQNYSYPVPERQFHWNLKCLRASVGVCVFAVHSLVLLVLTLRTIGDMPSAVSAPINSWLILHSNFGSRGGGEVAARVPSERTGKRGDKRAMLSSSLSAADDSFLRSRETTETRSTPIETFKNSVQMTAALELLASSVSVASLAITREELGSWAATSSAFGEKAVSIAGEGRVRLAARLDNENCVVEILFLQRSNSEMLDVAAEQVVKERCYPELEKNSYGWALLPPLSILATAQPAQPALPSAPTSPHPQIRKLHSFLHTPD